MNPTCVVWQEAWLSNNGNKFESKAQNGMWMGKSKQSPEKSWKFGKDPLKISGKMFDFAVGHPVNILIVFLSSYLSLMYFNNTSTHLVLG